MIYVRLRAQHVRYLKLDAGRLVCGLEHRKQGKIRFGFSGMEIAKEMLSNDNSLFLKLGYTRSCFQERQNRTSCE